ncbi:MAG: TIR domain-containing protein [Promethearchaeota archaeon]
MIKIRIFISYKYEDYEYANGLEGLLKNPNNIYRHSPKREKEDMRENGEEAVRSYLIGLIRDCDALVCLIGRNTHNATGVMYELEAAKSLGKKIIAVRIPNTFGGLPKLLKSWGIIEIEWNALKINNSLSN